MWRLLLLLLVGVSSCNGQSEDEQIDWDDAWFTDDMYSDPYFNELKGKGHGLIFPGTKWCGKGSKAEDYDDLGKYKETDMCCRDHDNCPDLMAAGESAHGLTNPSSSTSLHCDCDRDFHGCLRAIKDVPSKSVGTLYFDIVGKKCYEKNNGTYEWKDPKPFSRPTFASFLMKLIKANNFAAALMLSFAKLGSMAAEVTKN